MTPQKKVAVCSALAGILGFIGLIATPLCQTLPVPWQTVCILGGKAAVVGADEIRRSLPDAGH
jgi:ABC-type Fe3+-siderophore transport system permease subunit